MANVDYEGLGPPVENDDWRLYASNGPPTKAVQRGLPLKASPSSTWGPPLGVAISAQMTSPMGSRTMYIYHEGRKIGWVPQAFVPKRFVAYENYSGYIYMSEEGMCQVVLTTYTQDKLPALSTLMGSLPYSCEPVESSKPASKFKCNLPITKEPIMPSLTKTLLDNKSAVRQASYLEAGRIANRQAAKLAAKAAPDMVAPFINTPLGKLLIANAVNIAISELRPTDAMLRQLGMSMITSAYTDVIATFDLDGLIDKLTGSPEIKKALSKLAAVEGGAA
jgi:hypothetical protein